MEARDFEVGDRAFIKRSRMNKLSEEFKLVTIERITKTMIIAGGYRFRKADFRMITRDEYFPPRLKPYNAELHLRISADAEKRQLAGKIVARLEEELRQSEVSASLYALRKSLELLEEKE